jgi:hypothetical protein
MIGLIARVLRYVSAVFDIFRRVNGGDGERNPGILKQAPLACIQPVCACSMRGRGTWAHRTKYGIHRVAIRVGSRQPVIIILLAVLIPFSFQLVQPTSVPGLIKDSGLNLLPKLPPSTCPELAHCRKSTVSMDTAFHRHLREPS